MSNSRDDASRLLNRGLAFFEKSEWGEAIFDLKRACNLGVNFDQTYLAITTVAASSHNSGVEFMATNDWETAARLFMKAILYRLQIPRNSWSMLDHRSQALTYYHRSMALEKIAVKENESTFVYEAICQQQYSIAVLQRSDAALPAEDVPTLKKYQDNLERLKTLHAEIQQAATHSHSSSEIEEADQAKRVKPR